MILTRYWYFVDLPYACFCLNVHDGIVVQGPPIMRWAIGKPITEVVAWIKKKRGKAQRIDSAQWSYPGSVTEA